MKISHLLAAVLAGSMAVPVMGKTVKHSGMACWTGKAEVIATDKDNRAFTYKMNWLWTPDQDSYEEDALHNGECVGSGVVVNGKSEPISSYCTHIRADGTYMTKLAFKPDGSTSSTYFGGTGKYKGITGFNEGGPQMPQKGPKGMFASCRKVKGEMTIPD